MLWELIEWCLCWVLSYRKTPLDPVVGFKWLTEELKGTLIDLKQELEECRKDRTELHRRCDLLQMEIESLRTR